MLKLVGIRSDLRSQKDRSTQCYNYYCNPIISIITKKNVINIQQVSVIDFYKQKHV